MLERRAADISKLLWAVRCPGELVRNDIRGLQSARAVVAGRKFLEQILKGRHMWHCNEPS